MLVSSRLNWIFPSSPSWPLSSTTTWLWGSGCSACWRPPSPRLAVRRSLLAPRSTSSRRSQTWWQAQRLTTGCDKTTCIKGWNNQVSRLIWYRRLDLLATIIISVWYSTSAESPPPATGWEGWGSRRDPSRSRPLWNKRPPGSDKAQYVRHLELWLCWERTFLKIFSFAPVRCSM